MLIAPPPAISAKGINSSNMIVQIMRNANFRGLITITNESLSVNERVLTGFLVVINLQILLPDDALVYIFVKNLSILSEWLLHVPYIWYILWL
jgi:hypothetical protein